MAQARTLRLQSLADSMMDSPQVQATFIYIQIQEASQQIVHFSAQIAKVFRQAIGFQKRQRLEYESPKLL